MKIHGGFELPIIFHGKLLYEENSKAFFLYDLNPFINQKYLDTYPPAFSIGPGACSGFEIEIIKNFSIGGEVAFALLYTRLAGQLQGEYIDFVTNETSYSGHDVSQSKIRMSNVVKSLSVTYQF